MMPSPELMPLLTLLRTQSGSVRSITARMSCAEVPLRERAVRPTISAKMLG
jgi:hypothetical protein